MARSIPAVLVAARGAFEGSGGVQQACGEYIAALRLAEYAVVTVYFDARASLIARIWNRFKPRVLLVQMPVTLWKDVENSVQQTKAEVVFFFPNLFPELSKRLRHRFPEVQQVLLSVGVESIDFCIDQQIRRRNGDHSRSARAERMLGQQLLSESEQRSAIDAVVTMSPLEAEVEKWLGAPRAVWFPRTIIEQPLQSRPINGRVGCVSTLNHPPNLDGLVQVFEALAGRAPEHFRFRLVGRPEKAGRILASRFSFVEYVGELDDAALRDEASTWCCFVHPLFVYAKGSSTKLAVGLGWGLPIATTEFGARGYWWDRSVAPLAQNPAELAQFILRTASLEAHTGYREQTRKISAAAPTLATVASDLRKFLARQESLIDTPVADF